MTSGSLSPHGTYHQKPAFTQWCLRKSRIISSKTLCSICKGLKDQYCHYSCASCGFFLKNLLLWNVTVPSLPSVFLESMCTECHYTEDNKRIPYRQHNQLSWVILSPILDTSIDISRAVSWGFTSFAVSDHVMSLHLRCIKHTLVTLCAWVPLPPASLLSLAPCDGVYSIHSSLLLYFKFIAWHP